RPHAFDELLAAEPPTIQSPRGELPLDDVLRGDPRVVGAGHPARDLAEHAVVAAQDVLDRIVERMAHVQRSGDVRGRDDHRKRLPRALLVAVKVSPLAPHAVPAFLDCGRLVSLGEFHYSRTSFDMTAPSASIS